MTIIAVRHTTVDVPSGICYGQTDVETAATFENEKEQIVRKLLPEQFQAVYSSPLTRCRKLAETISKGLPVIYDSRLMELDFGTWEGQPWDEISRTDEAKRWFSDWINTSCPEGESYQQLIVRVQDFLRQITCIHKKVLIVTHAGPIRALTGLISTFEKSKTFEIKIDFGSITKLIVNDYI